MAVNRGKLREWITIERAQDTPGDWQNAEPQWIEVLSTWAGYEPEKIRTDGSNQTVEYLSRATFTAEECGAVRESDRIRWGGRMFNVAAVREIDSVGQWYAIEVVELKDA